MNIHTPPQTVLYFAYGSNMLTRRLTERVASARRVATGHVVGRKLTFDKIGQDRSGKCDIEATDRETDRVHGVIYELHADHVPTLDRYEGLGHGYDRHHIDIATDTDVVTAMTYVATHKDPTLLPFCWYKELVIAGAREHALPADYIDHLRAVPREDDPEGRAIYEALLRID